MIKENINIFIGVATFIATIVSGYVGLKLKSLKSEMKENHVSKTDYKEDNESLESKLKDLDDKVTSTQKNMAVNEDRVKAIFRQMDKQGEQITYQFEKIESSMKDSFREMKDMIKELYQTKEDKKK